jgi:hypothetical protein
MVSVLGTGTKNLIRADLENIFFVVVQVDGKYFKFKSRSDELQLEFSPTTRETLITF